MLTVLCFIERARVHRYASKEDEYQRVNQGSSGDGLNLNARRVQRTQLMISM